MLQGLTPIVRGRCDVCGTTRNLWVSEMASGEKTIPCAHQDRGCKGVYKVVYTGPKKWIPQELNDVVCTCGATSAAPCKMAPEPGQLPPKPGTKAEPEPEPGPMLTLAPELEPEPAPEPGSTPVAVPHHSNAGLGEDEAVAAAIAASLRGAPAPDPSSEAPRVCGDMAECAICTDELVLADAAMRCSAPGGQAHYYHAQCLGEWVAQCNRNGTGPTCPQCRGPVQVRRRRLEEFIAEIEAGGDMGADDQAALRCFNAELGQTSGDEDEWGWSDVKQGLWTAGALAGATLAAGAIISAIATGISKSSSNGRRRQPPGESQ